MNRNVLVARGIVSVVLLNSMLAWAQSMDESPRPLSSGRLTLGYRGAFNVSATFRNSGAIPAQSSPGPASGGAIDRSYDDGFNRVDASGNVGGLTSFWGYQQAGQVSGNNTIVMTSSSVDSAAASAEVTEGPQPGFGLTFDYPICAAGRWHFGVETAFGYSALRFQTEQNAPGNVVRISDAFALNGITPPVAPYSGPYNGPGPLIGDSPDRTVTTIPGGTTVASQNQMDASLYELQLGPYVEISPVERLSFTLSGGAALAWVDSTAEFTDRAIVPGAGILQSSAENSDGDFLLGGFVSGQASFALTHRFSLNAGAQYQYLPRFSQSAGGHDATLNMGGSVFLTAGVGVTF